MRISLRLLPLCASLVFAIWPIPSSYNHGDGVLWIDESVKVSYNGSQQVHYAAFSFLPDVAHFGQQPIGTYGNPTGLTASTIVKNAITRTYDTLFNKNFVPWKFHPRFSNFEPSTSNGTYIKSILLQQTAADPASLMKSTTGSVDESYSLSMTEDGEVTITAASSIGILYGLTTFTQLFYQHSTAPNCAYTTLAPVEITDSPKFGWRGLNVDTTRTFKPMSDLYAMVR